MMKTWYYFQVTKKKITVDHLARPIQYCEKGININYVMNAAVIREFTM